MDDRRLVAYALVALGTITLLARLSPDPGWLWIGVVAAALVYAHARTRTYSFLVLGGILAGTSVGILLQQVVRVEGAFLVGLGAGIAAIDVLERRPNRLPRQAGAFLALLGLVLAFAEARVFDSVWFALLLVAAGAWLLLRGPDAPFPPPQVAPPSPPPAPGASPPERAGPTDRAPAAPEDERRP